MTSLNEAEIDRASAGFNVPEPFTNVTVGHYDEISEVNVRALFFNTQYAAKRMVADGIAGSIVLTCTPL